MRLVLQALLIGGVVESLFAWMMVGSSWGPCGPGTVLGFVGLFAHFIPGMVIGVIAEGLGATKATVNGIMFGSQFVF